jgi:phosphate transport system protein
MQFGRHISERFNVELEAIRSNVLAMGGMVEQQFAFAMQALHKQDYELARQVIKDDRKVNAMEVSIDQACTRIIARRQPTAKDLRLVMAIIKTITDLERIGDVASRIAKAAIETPNSEPYQKYRAALESLSQKALNMLHQVLDAFARMDVDAAGEIHRLDDDLDKEYKQVVKYLMEFMQDDPETIPDILQVMWSARAIERVGDRCQNICEYIIYFVKGKDVRHLDEDEIAELLR